jgi:hypothetical protein
MCDQPPGTGICVTFSHLWWGDASRNRYVEWELVVDWGCGAATAWPGRLACQGWGSADHSCSWPVTKPSTKVLNAKKHNFLYIRLDLFNFICFLCFHTSLYFFIIFLLLIVMIYISFHKLHTSSHSSLVIIKHNWCNDLFSWCNKHMSYRNTG